MSEASVAAGRGVLYIALAKLYFMVAGYVIYFVLPRLLGSEVLWGNYLLVIGLVSVIDNVLVTATIQTVSKFTAQDDTSAEGVKRTALRVQLLLGGGIAVVYLAAAPFIAAWERDESLTNLYRLSTGIMICYAFYAVFVGSLNGLRKFGRQAALDASFATLRCALILGFAAVGLGVGGAVLGFVSAAAVILVSSAAWVGLPRGAQRFASGPLIRFTAKLYLYTLALNLIMRVDLFLLKRLVSDLSDVVGTAARASLASAQAGYYGTAQSLAFIPYQAILAIAFVVFPLVSRSTFEKDLSATQGYIRRTLRLSLVLTVGIGVVFIANPEAVIGVVYPVKYRVGGAALRILTGGMVCFSIFTIVNTILNGAGKAGHTILSGIATLVFASTANAIAIPRAGSVEGALAVAATATTGAMAAGMGLSLLLLYREYRAGLPMGSLLRVALAAGVAITVGHFVPEASKLVTLAECFLVIGAYSAVLLATGELKPEDRALLARVFLRRK